MQIYSRERLEVIFDSAVSRSGLMAVLLYVLILLTRTAIFFVAHRLSAFFFDQMKYIFRDITLLI
jgi:cell division protein FtsL